MEKYKAGDKFIIEIDHRKPGQFNTYVIKGIEPVTLMENEIDKLQRIPDFQEALCKAVMGEKVSNREAIAYYEGLSAAWEATRKIVFGKNKGGYGINELCEIFDTYSAHKIVDRFEAEEAIRKISDYEKKKEKMFCVGDVIQHKDQPEIIAIVTFADSEDHFDAIKLSESDKYGEKYGIYYKMDVSFWKKTGQHYNLDEIFKLVQAEGDE